ncbi:hypothetical protein OAK19_04780 [Aureispira]|nr:hypothetical protein [Aureispira sp.]
MKHLTYSIISVCFSILLLSSCSDRTAKEYAKKFCSCSMHLSEAENQLISGAISQEKFNQISKEHETCMGDDDPLKSLKDKPKEQEKFKIDFIKELEKRCPDIARKMGF